jgi:hypothetical protein
MWGCLVLDFLAQQALALRRAGFTAIQLPPTSKAQGGDGAGCDGYGLFDPCDLGNKNQQGSLPTRYGSKDALTRFVAVAHACGLRAFFRSPRGAHVKISCDDPPSNRMRKKWHFGARYGV